MLFVEFAVLCPYLGESTVGGSTVYAFSQMLKTTVFTLVELKPVWM